LDGRARSHRSGAQSGVAAALKAYKFQICEVRADGFFFFGWHRASSSNVSSRRDAETEMDRGGCSRLGGGLPWQEPDRDRGLNERTSAGVVFRFVLLIALALTTLPARAAVFDESDTSRLADINEAIKSFEDGVSSALHDLPPTAAEQIESYAYVQLNLEAAHERLNTIFMLLAVSIYMDSSSDQLLTANVMHAQLLPQSKNYLNEKIDAIASMAAAHPENKVFALYRARAGAILGDRAIPLLDELYRRTGDLPH
jgi:hypothetical protein